MKIFIICSKAFYEKIPPIKSALEKVGHIISLPNFMIVLKQKVNIVAQRNTLSGKLE